jgi:hypothetical protein
MRKLALALSFVAAMWILGLNTATAQRHSGGHGKPSQTGVEHAETAANPNGVQHGIEKAEAKQSLHKSSKKANKGKSKDKHKSRKPSSASH